VEWARGGMRMVRQWSGYVGQGILEYK